jgi:NodT family efflux transporter outer membrane factor (OMF) lipoprotein
MKKHYLLCCLGLLAGCNLAPRYERPAAAAPAAFKEAAVSGESSGFRPAQPQDQRLRSAWWETYDDPQLNQLEARVASSNQSVVAAAAVYRQARSLVVQARAAYLPTVALVPGVTRSRSSAGAGGAGAGAAGGAPAASTTAGSQRTLFVLPIDASYEIDLWGSVANTVRQNSALASASAADWANVVLSMQAEVAQDYFALRAADEQRRLLTTTLDDYRDSLKLVMTLFNSGLVAEEDLSQAQLQLATAQVQATDLGIVRAQYEHAIAVLVGVPPSRFSVAEAPLVPKLPLIPLAMPSDLLERRPDVAAAERRVAAANAAIGIARAAYFPALSISASAGFESQKLNNILDWPNRFWSVGPSLAENLFDGGARRAATARAMAAYDQDVAQYRQTVLAAFQSVEDSLVALRVLSSEASQEHVAVLAARRAVELSVARYKQGLDSFVNVITAQNSFLVSRLGELSVQLRALTASIGLIKNLGGGWPAADSAQADPTRSTPNAVTPDPGSVPAVFDRAAPNPPTVSKGTHRPEDLLKQDDSAMAPGGPPSG